jgi:hypothetical protein
MKLVTVDPEVTRVKKRKVVTVLRDQDDGALTVQVDGAHLPMEEFLENHMPLQVGGFSQDGPRLVALMIAEEVEPDRTASLGF